jgi:hypothetical protein
LPRIRPAKEDVVNVFPGDVDDGVPDGDAEAFGFLAPADGDADTLDGEGVGDFFFSGNADGSVS